MFAITDQRVLRLYKGRSLQVQSVPADRIGALERIENADGSGSIKIALSAGTDADGARTTDYFVLGEVPNVHDGRRPAARAARSTRRGRRSSS